MPCVDGIVDVYKARERQWSGYQPFARAPPYIYVLCRRFFRDIKPPNTARSCYFQKINYFFFLGVLSELNGRLIV
ncbi:hypothetical protein Y032_0069g326 [Ancylostoma ceylanicum]|uniref:Uncharacterized protein n=1 Tax=Ancylostoma ceylanicum TaxID=53326 RepID=A0A016TXU5_9BILA|nr:hypothetical protein Y032_0069g326 [Ancylostoma ceylanicum]